MSGTLGGNGNNGKHDNEAEKMEKAEKDVALNRHDDGTPSVMRKSTVYTELHFYRKSDVLVQLTKAFCFRFLPRYGDRTVDQILAFPASSQKTWRPR